jgi:hypothetical protein
MTRYFLTPAKQPYRVRAGAAQAEAFHEKDGWFGSCCAPHEDDEGGYFRPVWFIRAWWHVWRMKGSRR